ncbi:hypothetical protein H632_c614p0 [Helicosporidium sp. ATCC 50920]|nr:hypothetical protein H632_c614p0 [Helicosporidium sp. ATCC 50920]|eukprot:KDD75567.1 hypothetical protein H632_c614p0 [Helicosporidium sp. ATCC 50920]
MIHVLAPEPGPSLWRWDRSAPFSAAGVSPRSPATSDDVPPPQREITKEDVHVQFARSSGAGGQHVNKVSTKVDMRLKLSSASWLHPAVKEVLRKMEKGRINKDDELVVTSQRTRSQGCVGGMRQATQPIPEDLEKKAKLQRQADEADRARLLQKKARSDKKASRRADW